MESSATPRKPSSLFNGWPLLGVIAALLLAMAIAIVAAMPGVDGMRMLIRATARTSVLLFLAAFLASAAWTLAPSAATRWLRANRRQFGLSFAVSHLIHAFAIYSLSQADPALFAQLVMPATFVTGGLAYVFIALMSATSFDRTAAWLGRRNWRMLHTAGIWYLWVSFVFTLGKRLSQGPFYAVMLAVLAAALCVRIAAVLKTRGARHAAGTHALK